MSEDTWGPWTEHVPGPCPVPVGTWVQAVQIGIDLVEKTVEGRIGQPGYRDDCWQADSPFHGTCMMVLRYRVRMDREHSGMSVLRSLLNGIPVKETEDA